LANNGEKLVHRNANGHLVTSVRYDDGSNWPRLANGNGHSQEIVDPLGNTDSHTNWVSRLEPGGTPGSNSARTSHFTSPPSHREQ